MSEGDSCGANNQGCAGTLKTRARPRGGRGGSHSPRARRRRCARARPTRGPGRTSHPRTGARCPPHGKTARRRGAGPGRAPRHPARYRPRVRSSQPSPRSPRCRSRNPALGGLRPAAMAAQEVREHEPAPAEPPVMELLGTHDPVFFSAHGAQGIRPARLGPRTYAGFRLRVRLAVDASLSAWSLPRKVVVVREHHPHPWRPDRLHPLRFDVRPARIGIGGDVRLPMRPWEPECAPSNSVLPA